MAGLFCSCKHIKFVSQNKVKICKLQSQNFKVFSQKLVAIVIMHLMTTFYSRAKQIPHLVGFREIEKAPLPMNNKRYIKLKTKISWLNNLTSDSFIFYETLDHTFYCWTEQPNNKQHKP